MEGEEKDEQEEEKTSFEREFVVDVRLDENVVASFVNRTMEFVVTERV